MYYRVYSAWPRVGMGRLRGRSVGSPLSGSALGWGLPVCPAGLLSALTSAAPSRGLPGIGTASYPVDGVDTPSATISLTAGGPGTDTAMATDTFEFRHPRLGAVVGRDGDVVSFRGIPYATLADRLAEAQLVEQYPTTPLDATELG